MTGAHRSYETVLRLLGARTGLSFPPSRRENAELTIRRAMARAGIVDPDRYPDLLATNEKALDDLIIDLTVGETYFFREPAQFEFIRREVLPEVRRRRGDNHTIRAWSAGCASGEEAYSLAIVFEEERLAAQAQILATDISRAALARTRAATYGAWSLRGDSAAAAQAYLSRRKDRYVLDERIRRRVSIERLNLALDVYPSFATGTWGMDLILCRNVLIYFDRETVRTVARRLFDSLAAGGWLITASSDPSPASDAPYENVVTNAGLFYRRPSIVGDSLSVVRGQEELARVRNGEVGAAAAQIKTLSADITTSLCPPLGDDEPRTTECGSCSTDDLLAQAREAFARGDYARACELARDLKADDAASALHVRSLANLDTLEAERACAEAKARHPLSTELHYLHTVLLMDLGRNHEAAGAARRVIYLDRSLVIVHFTLGSILWRCGDLQGARRAYRNAHNLCATRPADEILPLSDGEQAGRLAEAAAGQLTALEAPAEIPS